MTKVILIVSFAVLITSFSISACNQKRNTANNEGSDEITISNDSLIKRGSYLVTIMGCHDCHSPKKMGPQGPEIDTARLLSGHPAQLPVPKIQTTATKEWIMTNPNLTAWVGPWGVSFTANLSSDETGIGNWSEQQFFTAIRKGKFKGLENSRDLLPPMPWPMIANATDEDLRAIFAYLKSTPPVKNVVPAPIAPDKLAALSE